jgi:hypothetical protein
MITYNALFVTGNNTISNTAGTNPANPQFACASTTGAIKRRTYILTLMLASLSCVCHSALGVIKYNMMVRSCPDLNCNLETFIAIQASPDKKCPPAATPAAAKLCSRRFPGKEGEDDGCVVLLHK